MEILTKFLAAKIQTKEKVGSEQILCSVKHRIKGLRPVSGFW